MYLKKHRRGITPAIAKQVLGIERLAARIYDLREAGVRIASQLRVDDAGHRYATYSLKRS